MNHAAGAADVPTLRVRLVLARGRAIGPGKADLLAAIDELGSIAAAGRSMRMSYQRAWSLIEELNAMFREPLVAATRGGVRRGGARLTAVGRSVLERYRAIEQLSSASCREHLAEIAELAQT